MAEISVVVPIYNVELYLPACLQSIARQSLRDLDVVLVDDGSSDRSAAIAEHFCRHDRRFRLLRQANAGLGAARNAGLAAAECEYLAFIDSDDVLPANAYELLLGSLRRSGSDFATGNVRRLSSAGLTQAQFLARRSGERGGRRTSRASRRWWPTARPGTSSGGGHSGTRTTCASRRGSST